MTFFDLPDNDPLFKVFATKNEEDQGIRNTTYVVGHFGYFLINFLNILALLLIEGWAFGRLRKSFLSKISLLACCTQILSCMVSITRYNYQAELFMSGTGTLFSIIAFTFLNITYVYVAFTSPKVVKAGIAIWVVVAIVIASLSYVLDPFSYVRPFVGACQVWHIVGIILGHRAYEKGIIDIKSVAKESTRRVFMFCIFLNVFSFCTNFSLMPIFYPFLGLSFTANVIFMAFVGTSNYMDHFGSKDKNEEQQPDEGKNEEQQPDV